MIRLAFLSNIMYLIAKHTDNQGEKNIQTGIELVILYFPNVILTLLTFEMMLNRNVRLKGIN